MLSPVHKVWPQAPLFRDRLDKILAEDELWRKSKGKEWDPGTIRDRPCGKRGRTRFCYRSRSNSMAPLRTPSYRLPRRSRSEGQEEFSASQGGKGRLVLAEQGKSRGRLRRSSTPSCQSSGTLEFENDKDSPSTCYWLKWQKIYLTCFGISQHLRFRGEPWEN